MQWQQALLDQLGVASPAVDAVRPYGSVLTPSELDRWRSLDAEVDLSTDVEGRMLLGAELWAWQSSLDDDVQRVRAVLRDGRRCDLGGAWCDAHASAAAYRQRRAVRPDPRGDTLWPGRERHRAAPHSRWVSLVVHVVGILVVLAEIYLILGH